MREIQLMSLYSIVLITVPDENMAEKIAKSLVKKKLAACVNIIDQISAIFAWQSTINTENESMLLIKTTEIAYPSLESAILQQHPYDIPEIIAIPIKRGAEDYLNWVRENTCTK